MYRAFGTGLVCVHHAFPVFIRNPLRPIRLAVIIHYHSMAQSLDFASLAVTQKLLHLETGVAYLEDAALAGNRVMKQHRLAKVQVHMDEDILESQPVDFSLEDMFEIAASTHVEVVALRPVVDVIVGVEVAHADLDGTGEHIFVDC